VRFVWVATAPQTSHDSVDDAGPTEGIQRYTWITSGITNRATIVVKDDTAYLRADGAMLVNLFQFVAIPAFRYSNVWLEIPRSSSAFSGISAAVTFTSAIDQLQLPGPYQMAPSTTIHGVRALGISGTEPVSGGQPIDWTLYVAASGSPLPLEQISSEGGAKTVVSLSRWNEVVEEPTPVRPTAIATTGLISSSTSATS
jgi:hypothetical protein